MTRQPGPVPTLVGRKGLRAGNGDDASLLRIGELLDGHYEVIRLIGSGGMAEVYLGVDHWLKREVAIKVTTRALEPHLEREAQVLASFRHPGLVAVHAYGRHKGLPYLVLEFLPGVSLSGRLTEPNLDALSVDDALNLIVGLCEALMPLHERGLVHCDLKPANIMCASGRVVLIDFGLVWDSRTERSDVGRSGSPPFMAPEVIAGMVRRDQAHLIDVYALGMILYALLAGETPFTDPDPAVIMARQLREEASPLAARRADLPPRLSAIIASLVQRDPSQRPGDVVTVRDALLGIPRRGADRRAP